MNMMTGPMTAAPYAAALRQAESYVVKDGTGAEPMVTRDRGDPFGPAVIMAFTPEAVQRMIQDPAWSKTKAETLEALRDGTVGMLTPAQRTTLPLIPSLERIRALSTPDEAAAVETARAVDATERTQGTRPQSEASSEATTLAGQAGVAAALIQQRAPQDLIDAVEDIDGLVTNLDGMSRVKAAANDRGMRDQLAERYGADAASDYTRAGNAQGDAFRREAKASLERLDRFGISGRPVVSTPEGGTKAGSFRLEKVADDYAVEYDAEAQGVRVLRQGEDITQAVVERRAFG